MNVPDLSKKKMTEFISSLRRIEFVTRSPKETVDCIKKTSLVSTILMINEVRVIISPCPFNYMIYMIFALVNVHLSDSRPLALQMHSHLRPSLFAALMVSLNQGSRGCTVMVFMTIGAYLSKRPEKMEL